MMGSWCFVKKLIMYFNMNKCFCLYRCVCVCVMLGLGLIRVRVHSLCHAWLSTWHHLHVHLSMCTTTIYITHYCYSSTAHMSIVPILSTIPSCVYSLHVVHYILPSTSLYYMHVCPHVLHTCLPKLSYMCIYCAISMISQSDKIYFSKNGI